MRNEISLLSSLALLVLLSHCKKDDPQPNALVPFITTISPTSGNVGTVVTIEGKNFGTDASKVKISFNGVGATTQSVSDSQIVTTAPVGVTTGIVKVDVNGRSADGPVFTVIPPPTISSIAPTSGSVNTTVTINGANFGTDATKVTVFFNGVAATVQSVTDSQITTTAPVGATTGIVKVEVNTQSVDGPVFTYLQPAKKWRLKSVIYNYSPTALQHVIYFYNDRNMITKIGRGLSGVKDTVDTGIQEYVDYTYDSIDRVSFIKPNQAPGFKFVHLSPYIIQVYSYPHYATDAVTTYNLNGNGHNELDSYESYLPPGSISPGKTNTEFSYSDLGGAQSKKYITTNLSNNTTTTQDAWAFYGPGLNSTPIANPFKDLSTEQRLVHYTNVLFRFAEWDMCGPSWSTGIYEIYSYSTGSKVVSGYEGSNYKVDANGNVVRIMTYFKYDSNTDYKLISTYWLTYEEY